MLLPTARGHPHSTQRYSFTHPVILLAILIAGICAAISSPFFHPLLNHYQLAMSDLPPRRIGTIIFTPRDKFEICIHSNDELFIALYVILFEGKPIQWGGPVTFVPGTEPRTLLYNGTNFHRMLATDLRGVGDRHPVPRGLSFPIIQGFVNWSKPARNPNQKTVTFTVTIAPCHVCHFDICVFPNVLGKFNSDKTTITATPVANATGWLRLKAIRGFLNEEDFTPGVFTQDLTEDLLEAIHFDFTIGNPDGQGEPKLNITKADWCGLVADDLHVNLREILMLLVRKYADAIDGAKITARARDAVNLSRKGRTLLTVLINDRWGIYTPQDWEKLFSQWSASSPNQGCKLSFFIFCPVHRFSSVRNLWGLNGALATPFTAVTARVSVYTVRLPAWEEEKKGFSECTCYQSTLFCLIECVPGMKPPDGQAFPTREVL
jgi:hypothetical protein